MPVLVWVNPVDGGRDRSVLDAMLRDVAASGVFVSTHPDVILKLGTKEVLHQTRDIGWGSDTHLYRSLDQMRRELPMRLAGGKARVLKQYRGQSGDGVWKVEAVAAGAPAPESLVRVRHAKRGSPEEDIALSEFYGRCAQYFAGDGRMVDQAYQERLPEGHGARNVERVDDDGHDALDGRCIRFEAQLLRGGRDATAEIDVVGRHPERVVGRGHQPEGDAVVADVDVRPSRPRALQVADRLRKASARGERAGAEERVGAIGQHAPVVGALRILELAGG